MWGNVIVMELPQKKEPWTLCVLHLRDSTVGPSHLSSCCERATPYDLRHVLTRLQRLSFVKCPRGNGSVSNRV